MTPETINRLNQLNHDFYQQVAQPFSESRHQAWEGWSRLLPHIRLVQPAGSTLKVLDLGCGNGRFGEFLLTHLPEYQIEYTGLDSNQSLLDITDEALAGKNIKLQLIKVDIVAALADQKPLTAEARFDVIVAFGVLHHIPSFDLRQRFISTVCHLLQPQGMCSIAAWQFKNNTRLQQKIVDPSLVDITTAELEDNDYILSWDRGQTAYRYCHFCDDQELHALVPSSARLLDSYLADGHEHNLNHYLILACHDTTV